MNSIVRHKTEEHLQLETLLNSLPLEPSQRNEIHEQFLKQSAGYYGETNTDHYLRYPHSSPPPSMTFGFLMEFSIFKWML
ncbi:hypothetical protein [Halobacillus mangrovi]|uniref:Uncharacterized protein n=1 Tax=Halobacillus mangrovi TaxID=402384 RepID=A0A1W5ZYX6_9BACI|nr:hypothetical protein [Halobacillus mangrovi]ARI78427.1 hypothetical protein HM131_16990 [Halobacillus mangrovi]